MDKKWLRARHFESLSIRDLLDAREAYHVHLAHLDNVFATAVGRYLVRETDPDADDPHQQHRHGEDPPPEPRTLANSAPRRWSWPCIVVFVERWQDRGDFAEAPDSMVPRYLYLPDGRVVPTCVVMATRDEAERPSSQTLTFPSDLIGGGYPVLTEVQGRQHIGSLGCLVTDGESIFALTNRHVAGDLDRVAETVVKGRRQKIGKSAGRELGKKRFAEVYDGWRGDRVLANLDAGLIRVEDVTQWTAQIYGLGEMGPIWDLNVDTFNLDVIGCPVVAFGAASGRIEGQIQALFYRYKTVGGVEYTTDFLIGPRQGAKTVGTMPGDSGTVWFEDNTLSLEDAKKLGTAGDFVKKYRPFALQWGGQSLLSPGIAETSAEFALAICLSTICRELDVELISSWNIGQPETWGAVGHFKVGGLACDLIADAGLRALFALNRDRIALNDATLEAGVPAHHSGEFAALADVADLVWRNTRKKDEFNHFADMDLECTADGAFKGQTLLSLTQGHPDKVDPDVWNGYYAAINAEKRGALPFRVWQMYDDMVDFAASGDLLRFVCAGGLMAHYVGDACQPLHVSQFHHGHPGLGEDKVHSVYETTMLNQHAAEMNAAVKQVRDSHSVAPPPVSGDGHDAAVAVVELMRRTIARLSPETVIQVYNDTRHRTAAMWDQLGDKTAQCLVDGAQTLAAIWQAAWKQGRPNAAPQVPANAFGEDDLAALYNTRTFVQSFELQELTRQGDKLVPR